MEKATPLAYGQRLPIAGYRRGSRVAFGSALSQEEMGQNGRCRLARVSNAVDSMHAGIAVAVALGSPLPKERGPTEAPAGWKAETDRVCEGISEGFHPAGARKDRSERYRTKSARLQPLFMPRGTSCISSRCRRGRGHCGRPCCRLGGRESALQLVHRLGSTSVWAVDVK